MEAEPTFLRTGRGLKISLRATVVPFARATDTRLHIFPELLYVTLLPVISPAVRVVTMSSDTAQRELRASPLKPKLASVCKPAGGMFAVIIVVISHPSFVRYI